MGYLIAAGAFLAVGIGLCIWAVVERKKRYSAELQCKDFAADIQYADRRVVDLLKRNKELKAESKKAIKQVDVIRTLLDVARTRLMTCNDPRTVKSWLDNEMNDKNV